MALTLVVPALDGPGDRPLAAADAEASGAAAAIVSMINSARSANGLRALSVSGDLTSAAATRAAAMANAGALSHTENLGGKVCCWSWLGENVGYAYSARQAHSMFMDSAPHRANLMKGSATDVGVAVVKRDGTLWVAEVFRTRSGSGGGGGGGGGGGSGGSQAPDGGSGDGRSGQEQTAASTTGSTSSAPVANSTAAGAQSAPSRRHSPAWQLRHRLIDLRSTMQQTVKQYGRLDPLLAAVHYTKTLDRVSR